MLSPWGPRRAGDRTAAVIPLCSCSTLFSSWPCPVASGGLTNYRSLYCFSEFKLLPVIFFFLIKIKKERRGVWRGERWQRFALCLASCRVRREALTRLGTDTRARRCPPVLGASRLLLIFDLTCSGRAVSVRWEEAVLIRKTENSSKSSSKRKRQYFPDRSLSSPLPPSRAFSFPLCCFLQIY